MKSFHPGPLQVGVTLALLLLRAVGRVAERKRGLMVGMVLKVREATAGETF